MDTRRQVMHGPVEARLLGPPPIRGRRTTVDELATFEALPEALAWVLGKLSADRPSGSVESGAVPGDWHIVGVVRVRAGEVMVFSLTYVNDGPDRKRVPDLAAEQEVAQLLPMRGYHQVVLPEPVTPLESLAPLLPNRVLNALLREGYYSVEQIAVLPEPTLNNAGLGMRGISEVRTALAAAGAVPTATTQVELTAEQVSELRELLPALAAIADAHDEHDLAERAAAFTRLLPD